jgi:hypothetical protein
LHVIDSVEDAISYAGGHGGFLGPSTPWFAAVASVVAEVMNTMSILELWAEGCIRIFLFLSEAASTYHPYAASIGEKITAAAEIMVSQNEALTALSAKLREQW